MGGKVLRASLSKRGVGCGETLDCPRVCKKAAKVTNVTILPYFKFPLPRREIYCLSPALANCVRPSTCPCQPRHNGIPSQHSDHPAHRSSVTQTTVPGVTAPGASVGSLTSRTSLPESFSQNVLLSSQLIQYIGCSSSSSARGQSGSSLSPADERSHPSRPPTSPASLPFQASRSLSSASLHAGDLHCWTGPIRLLDSPS